MHVYNSHVYWTLAVGWIETFANKPLSLVFLAVLSCFWSFTSSTIYTYTGCMYVCAEHWEKNLSLEKDTISFPRTPKRRSRSNKYIKKDKQYILLNTWHTYFCCFYFFLGNNTDICSCCCHLLEVIILLIFAQRDTVNCLSVLKCLP